MIKPINSKIWECTFQEKVNKKGEKINFPPIRVGRGRPSSPEIWYCVEDVLTVLQLSEDTITKIQKRDNSFCWSVCAISFNEHADDYSKADSRPFMSSRLLHRIARYSKIQHKAEYLDWLYSLNKEVEDFELDEKYQKVKSIFFQAPYKTEDVEKWKKDFKESYKDFKECRSLHFKPNKDKNLKFLFEVISFCRFVQVGTKEENEILQYHFSKAINAIKTIIEKGEK